MSKSVTVNIENITPEWASAELEKQEALLAKGDYRQRKLSDGVVLKYAADMAQGHWILSNQGIGFNDQGHLIDGRHRLWAVKKSGVTVPMLVMRGLAGEQKNGLTINPQDVVDTGRVRLVGQQLTIDGITSGNQKAAACRGIAILVSGSGDIRITTSQTRAILAIYGYGFERALEGLHSNIRLAKSYILAVTAMYRHISAKGADDFIESYYTGANLPEGSPILALKKFLTNYTSHGSFARTRDLLNGAALAISHFDEKTSINSIRKSSIGAEWLVENQKANARRVREILNLKY